VSASDLFTVLGGTSGGVALVMLVLFITGQIYSKSSYDDMKEQRDEWKRLAELAGARAEAGILAGRIVADALQNHGAPRILE
jgi:hypothetical protein